MKPRNKRAGAPHKEFPAPVTSREETRPLYHADTGRGILPAYRPPEPTVWELLGERTAAEYYADAGIHDSLGALCLAQALGFCVHSHPLPGADSVRGFSVLSGPGEAAMIGNMNCAGETGELNWAFGLMIAVHLIQRPEYGACVVTDQGVFFATDEKIIGFGVEPESNPCDLAVSTETLSRLEDFCFGLFSPRDRLRRLFRDCPEADNKTPEYFSSQLDMPVGRMRLRFEQLGLEQVAGGAQ